MLSRTIRVDLYQRVHPQPGHRHHTTHITSPPPRSILCSASTCRLELVAARRAVDRQPVFGTTGAFHTDYSQLARLGRAIDQATASGSEVATLLNHIGSEITDQWQDTFNNLSFADASSDSSTTKSRLSALNSSFSAFTSGLGEENLLGGGSLRDPAHGDSDACPGTESHP